MRYLTVEAITNLIERLPHSKTRVPFTYHHDYLRTHAVHAGMYRADIAKLKCWSELELYSGALMQLVTELGTEIFQHLSERDLSTIKEAAVLCKAYVKRVDEEQLEKYDPNE